MKYLIHTKADIFIVDDEAMTWALVVPAPDSGFRRKDGGKLSATPEIKPGHPMALLGPDGRIVLTSVVTRVMYPYEEDDIDVACYCAEHNPEFGS